MIPSVIEVKPLPQSCLWLRFHDGLEGFHDGLEGSVDLSGELWGPMFEPLKNPEVFQQVKVDPELETVVWPNGADLAPEFLDEAAQQASLPVG
jgi:hypothetical protein